jgi:hypothetical protein
VKDNEQMSEIKHHHPQEGPHPPHDEDYVPYWKRAHKDWRFWVGVAFIGAALTVYITTVDLSLVPRRAPQPASQTH